MRYAALLLPLLLLACPMPDYPTAEEIAAEIELPEQEQPEAPEEATPENSAPTAAIVAPESVTAESTALISADCYDPDGDVLSVSWQIAGETVEGIAAVYTPQVEGVVQVALTVSDGQAEARDSAEIIVLPKPWEPDAGTLYLFYDEPGGELYYSEQPTSADWDSRVRLFKLDAENMGLIFVAGERP